MEPIKRPAERARLVPALVRWAILLIGLGVIAMLLHAAPAAAQGPEAPGAATASSGASHCAGLMATDLSGVPDAPTRLTAAHVVEAAAGHPAYCEVEGYVSPQVGLLIRLPVQGWNGRFLEVGCGGFCGTFEFIRMCDEPLKTGYACITTDMGHRGTRGGGVEWAYNNPQAVIDFAYRATHVTALAGKAIVQAYYGRKPDRSYFHGCSCGGRQALVEAQRFPSDFEGVIVGAPAISYADVALGFARRAHVLFDANHKLLFDAKARQTLIEAVVARCDRNDGVKDGQIGDPRLCKFDPHDIVCTNGAASGCLTRQQADAAAAFYTEQRSASGQRIGQYGYALGAENSLSGIVDGNLTKPTFYEDFFKYMGLIPNPGPAWKFDGFNVESEAGRLDMIRGLLDATNPDFSRFKAAGGKLIFYHGWGDAAASPLASIALYKTIERTMGGRGATQDFLRFFMVPDMDHCWGGRGPWQINYLDYLEKWVEQGKAPDVMIGAHDSAGPLPGAKPDGRPTFTRPIFPYPLRAQYKGKGDPALAASFRAAATDKD